MKVLIIEAILLVVIVLVLYALRNKIRFFRGGYIIRRDSYMQDDQMKVLVEDTIIRRHKEQSVRSLRVDGTNLVYSRIPLDKENNVLFVYSYCAPLLAMLKGTGATPERVLVLGGGGGAVPLYVLQNYEKSQTDIVELSAESIRISKAYFLGDYAAEGGRAHFIHADAKDAVQTLQPPYQFIFCDLFIGGQPADIVYDAGFMQSVSKLAASNGLLVINGGGMSVEGVRVVLRNLLGAFAHAWVMLLSDGFVLLARNSPMPALDQLLRHGNGVVPLYPSMMVDADAPEKEPEA